MGEALGPTPTGAIALIGNNDQLATGQGSPDVWIWTALSDWHATMCVPTAETSPCERASPRASTVATGRVEAVRP